MVTPTSQSPHLHILIIPTLMIISRNMILILMITKSWFKKEFKIPSLIIKVHRFSDQLMFTCWHSYNLLFLLFTTSLVWETAAPLRCWQVGATPRWKPTHFLSINLETSPLPSCYISSFCWGMFKNNNQHLPDTSFGPDTGIFDTLFVKTFCC